MFLFAYQKHRKIKHKNIKPFCFMLRNLCLTNNFFIVAKFVLLLYQFFGFHQVHHRKLFLIYLFYFLLFICTHFQLRKYVWILKMIKKTSRVFSGYSLIWTVMCKQPTWWRPDIFILFNVCVIKKLFLVVVVLLLFNLFFGVS